MRRSQKRLPTGYNLFSQLQTCLTWVLLGVSFSFAAGFLLDFATPLKDTQYWNMYKKEITAFIVYINWLINQY